MHTPRDKAQDTRASSDSSRQTAPETVGTVNHCLCGISCLAVSVAVVAVLYPALTAVTRPLHLLSSTALVLILVVLWVLFWLGLEVARGQRASRQAADS